ncbi:MAG: phosphate regulon transcriptional regulator PhoB [Burkholderiaceae bacterium]
MNERVLVVEDEPAIRELVAVNLRHNGFKVSEAPDAAAAKSLIALEPPDVIVLDWMLPGQSGVQLARDLRDSENTRSLPIIMLTARSTEGDKLQGFDVGIDDYLTKPFSPRELIARLKALLRRAGDKGASDDETLEGGGLRLEAATRRVFGAGQRIELSPTEFRLLAAFMRNPERVLTRARLLDIVWGDSVFVEERTVDVHIRRLRLALREVGLDRLIETVRGGGYRFAPD